MEELKLKPQSHLLDVKIHHNLETREFQLYLEHWENFRYGAEGEVCCFCQGYYGPNFGATVCPTCHSFLFPADSDDPSLEVGMNAEKFEDSDSGNEEPTELNHVTHSNAPEMRSDLGYKSIIFQCRPAKQSNRPLLQPNPLAERISMLTSPRPPEEEDISPDFLLSLPTEVLLKVFSYLDDLSLYCASLVCQRWFHILSTEVGTREWRTRTLQRWPLFRFPSPPNSPVLPWRHIYANLVDSAPCLYCLHQISLHLCRDEGLASSLTMSLTSCDSKRVLTRISGKVPRGDHRSMWRTNRLQTEVRVMAVEPPEGIQAKPLDSYYVHWQASIVGPSNSPYEGGCFYLYIQLPCDYPLKPPLVRFLTKIFHPNVSRHGDIGIDCIQRHNWSLALTLSKILISIQSLLTDPYCYVCMEPAIGELYLREPQRFMHIASAWTRKYAMQDLLLL
ncbi:unnamed protein product [Darwinula stevensoni]|uniref:E2 ubiquitin-conjugating enzyme n=1 Tax=Darwinula stevensoni TaxID=69355 RepID=A0A7R8WY97_9CRUS|nr:unnamed protein product [Darwinula stevensoni]CAG0879089.1 unnamed protein product [Darwinula stevensoni]